MTKQSPYVKSNFPRIPDDHYPTVDTRCVDGLLSKYAMKREREIIDPCSPNGSSIVDYLVKLELPARGLARVDAEPVKDVYVVTNPPYNKGIVDEIIYSVINKIDEGSVIGAAFLMRTAFDHAAKRREMFDECKYYAGQIKLCFRPIWFEKKPGDNGPIHNYVWHIWDVLESRGISNFVRYYYPKGK